MCLVPFPEEERVVRERDAQAGRELIRIPTGNCDGPQLCSLLTLDSGGLAVTNPKLRRSAGAVQRKKEQHSSKPLLITTMLEQGSFFC